MPFQRVLNQLLKIRGVEAVSFLDSEGETILTSGDKNPETLKAFGAYQGIIMSSLKTMGLPPARSLVTRFQNRSVLTHCLKDGYFICVLFSDELNIAFAQHSFQDACSEIENEL